MNATPATLSSSFTHSARTRVSARAHWRRSDERRTANGAMTRLLHELRAMGEADTPLDYDEVSFIAGVFACDRRGHGVTMADVRTSIIVAVAPRLALDGHILLRDLIAIIAQAGNAVGGAPASQAAKRDAAIILSEAGVTPRDALSNGLALLGEAIAGQREPAATYHAATRH